MKCKMGWKKREPLKKKPHNLVIHVIFKRIVVFGGVVWFFNCYRGFLNTKCCMSKCCLHELCEVSETSGVISVSQVCQYLEQGFSWNEDDN